MLYNAVTISVSCASRVKLRERSKGVRHQMGDHSFSVLDQQSKQERLATAVFGTQSRQRHGRTLRSAAGHARIDYDLKPSGQK